MSESDQAARETGSPIPWERMYPGRLQWELDWLTYLGAAPKLVDEALKDGVAQVCFSWEVDGEQVELEATFPDSYPYVRPQVRLRNGATHLQRHVAPTDGTICLIGRDSRQWTPQLGLAHLVQEKLADALKGTGDEDPQAEPNEFWWNTARVDSWSYVLVDSGWELKKYDSGFLDIRYVAEPGRPPEFRALIERVLDDQKQVLAEWTGMIPAELARGKTARTRWVRTAEPLAPTPGCRDFQDLIGPSGPFGPQAGSPFAKRLFGTLYAIVHPTELIHNVIGDGWLFCLRVNKDRYFIPTFRAGATDIGNRVPSVQHLRDKTVLLVGAGAIGSFVAVDLARNGCRLLKIVEPDLVEPGNSIRWPLGASSWGVRKGEALRRFLEAEYPWCTVELCPVSIGDVGNAGRESRQLEDLFEGVDVIIDCTAHQGVTNALWHLAIRRERPMVCAWATPSVTGGVAASFDPSSGCPTCLEYAHSDGTIEPPPGHDDDTGLLQPPGCAERTFTGPSMNLEELALEVVRLTVELLHGKGDGSLVETLELVDGEGTRIPPSWRTAKLDRHPGCSCSR